MIDRDQLRRAVDYWRDMEDMNDDDVSVLTQIVEVARLVVEGREVWWCEPHEVGEPQQSSRCWRGVIAADLEERTADCRMVRMILIDGSE